jgi:hypothetical protein
VLYTATDVAQDLDGVTGVEVTRAERVEREVSTATGTRTALDLLLTARRT